MKKLGDVFDGGRLKRALARRMRREEKLFSAWERLMGGCCAAHTLHMRIRHGVLYVTLDSQAWLQEILMRDLEELAAEMARETGLVIARVKVKTGGR